MSFFNVDEIVRFYEGSCLVGESKIGTLMGEAPDDSDLRHFHLRLDGETEEGRPLALGIQIDFPGLRNAHVALPGAVYAGNRFRSKPYAYSCIVNDPEDFRADLPNTISNVHRMPRIQVLSGDLSMPAVGIADFESGRGVWIFTPPHTEAGKPLLEVTEDERGLLVTIMTPGVREEQRYFGCGEKWVPSEDTGWRQSDGPLPEIDVYVQTFPARDPHDVYQKLFELRHEVWPAGGRSEIPWSSAHRLIEDKFNAWSWEETDGYYACGDRQSRYAHWQVGWVGGGISSYALLSSGSELSKTRAMRTMDFMSTKGQSPSGFYWSFCVDGEVYSDMIDMDYGHDWHLVRRSGDALYFMVKQIWLAASDESRKQIWRSSVEKCANAFVHLWETEGQFGQFVSQITGEIRVGATTSGAIAPAGLALASQLLDRADLLIVAAHSAQSMVDRFLNLGYTSGGPGEAAQCPDSESAFGLLESLVTLFEVTQDPKWLPLAEQAAWLSASWVMPYDFQFPPDSTFGRLDMRTTGSVWANSQNKHSAPGICTLSGVSLFKLFRATGNLRYLDLLNEIAQGVAQYTSRDDRPVFGMPSGYMCERVNTSDWEHPVTPIGEGFNASCWCETSMMLTYAEVPGLYAQPDTGLCRMLDHGTASIVASDRLRVDFQIENPTAYDMVLRPFVEDSNEMGAILGQDFLARSAQLSIPAGQTRIYHYNRETRTFHAQSVI